MTNFLQPHGLQYARLLCPPLSTGVCSNSCPLSRWCCLTISSSVAPPHPALNVSPNQGLLQWVGSLHQVTKVLELQISITCSNEYSGLISFRIDWFELFAVQGTLQSPLQLISKASVLQCSAFFMVQLSHPHMTTGKTIALTRQTFVVKEISLLFNTLSRLVTDCLPKCKHLLMSWLQSLSPVILEFTPPQKKNKICDCFHFFPFYLPWSDGIRCHDLSFLNVEFQSGCSPLFFHPHQEFFSSSSLSAIRVVSSTHLRLLIFLPEILIPDFDSSSLEFRMMNSAYRLQYTALSHSFPNFEPVSCSTSGSSCSLLPFLKSCSSGC